MMLNPWLTLPFQAVRLGWETQSILADQMMRLAGLGTSERKSAGDFVADTTALPPADGVALRGPDITSRSGGARKERQTPPSRAEPSENSEEARAQKQKPTLEMTDLN
jgi:hypothetical protein